MMPLIIYPLLLPLVGAVLILLASFGRLKRQRAFSFLLTSGLVFLAIILLQTAMDKPPQVYALGNWMAPYGIVLVLDPLSALMVLMTSILAMAALWYAMSTNMDAKGSHFHVLFQIQLFGLNGAFMTGDVFNLFVFFEVLLLASYGLMLHGGGRLRTRAGLQYVVINLIGSTLFLFAVGALYGILGTLNIADMAVKVSHLPESEHSVVAAAGLLLLLVFGIKAAIFPLYLWLPQAYANASAPVAALFAIMTKVGLYAIIRVHGTVFGENAQDLAFYYIPWVLIFGLLTMILAAFGVMASRGLREQVAYLVLTSVATLLIGIGLNTQSGLSGTLYYLIHSTLMAGAFFLLADMIARGRGHFDDRFDSGPAIDRGVLLGGTFMFLAIAMTGIPPLSGFFGKVLILSAALTSDAFWWILATLLIAGLLMIIAMARSGSLLFYHTQPQLETDGKAFNSKAYMAIVWLLIVSPLLVILASPITEFTDSIAQQLHHPMVYIETVLNAHPVSN